MELDNVKKNRNRVIAVVWYVAVLFILASVITAILIVILSNFRGVNVTEVMESLAATDFTKYSIDVIEVNAISQGWGNFLGYSLAMLGVAILMKFDIVTDFKQLCEKKKNNTIYIILAAILFVGITYLVDFLVGLAAESSVNQTTIENIILNGGAVPMILATVLIAPVLEELIYRKAIFSFFKKYGMPACYIISILFFSLPHMISSDMSNIGMWLLQCIPYAVSGGLLCLLYHKSNQNVYAPIAAHMLNNFIAAMQIIYVMNKM